MASGVTTVPQGVSLHLDDRPGTRRGWLGDLWRYRGVLRVLSRTSFQVRYKRAALGIAWAVVVPLVQAAVLAFVFSKIARVPTGTAFGAYVLTGILPWSFFTQTLGSGSTAIVDSSTLADKVWFPRAILPAVVALANLPGFFVTAGFTILAMPILGADISARLLLLPLAILALLCFTTVLSALLSAIHVYVRDLRFLVQAVLVLWFYVTPIAYPKALLGHYATLFDFNPMTGIVALFRLATVGHEAHWHRPVGISLVVTLVLALITAEVHRRNDRLFIDLL